MTPHASSTFLDVSGLSVAYQSALVLDDFTVSLGRGELFVLLGPSGCGKTTALRTIAGLAPTQAGRVVIDGQDITDLPPHRRNVGMVFQNASLFPHLSVLQNVTFGLGAHSLRPQSRRERREHEAQALGMLELVGLADRAQARPNELSGGQQQRVALARALVTEPRALLLDEPLAALDTRVRGEVRQQLVRVMRQVGTTAIFVTHDQDEAFAIADRVGLMADGRLEQVGSPRDLYQRPASEFVRSFIGRVNRIPGPLIGRVDELVARPEQLRLAAPDAAPGAGVAPTLQATVREVAFLGSFQLVTVRLEDGTDVVVQCAHDEEHEPGERVLVLVHEAGPQID